MSKYVGRRRATERRGIPVLGWVAIAIALGLSTVTAAAVVTSPRDDGKAEAQAGERTGSASRPDRDRCGDAVTIGVPPAYLAAWQQALSGYWADAPCRPAAAVGVRSASVASDDAPAVDGWIPDDSTWISRAGAAAQGRREASRATPLARTPLVVATTAELDASIGGIQSALTPRVFGPLVRATRTFSDLGAADAGLLRIALPEPADAAAGALGFAALTQAATGRSLSGVPAYVDPTARDLTTIRTEHRVTIVGDDEAAVLTRLEPGKGTEANLVVTSEQAALSHNAAHPLNPVAVGYLGVDLTMSMVAIDPDAQAELDAVAAYLTGPDGARALSDAGLRPVGAATTPKASGPIRPAAYSTPGVTADPGQVRGLAQLFGAMHQRISSLVLLDASGSMLEPLPGGGVSKIDLVRRAARDTLRVASPRARAGLMTFRSDPSDRPVITTPVRLAANGSRHSGQLHSERMLEAVDTLRVDGGTPLYNAVRDAYEAAVVAYHPQMINQVVVLSDGRNEDAVGSISLGKLIDSLRAAADPQRPVRIIAIGYGPDADMAALNRIVATTHGRASWLRSVDGYSDAVQEALFSV